MDMIYDLRVKSEENINVSTEGGVPQKVWFSDIMMCSCCLNPLNFFLSCNDDTRILRDIKYITYQNNYSKNVIQNV